MRKCFLGLLSAAAVLVALTTSSAMAAPIPLSDLLVDGATITSGDKIFSDFTYVSTEDMPSASGVNVEALDVNGVYGLRFQGGFIDVAGGDPSDALITFNVSVADGVNMMIDKAILRANPAVFGGPGLATVTETFADTIIDDSLVVYDFGDGNILLEDTMDFAQGYKTLPVQKDILLYATGDAGAVSLSYVDQLFPQVPEPSSWLLVSAGLLCLGWIRRRQS